MKRFQQVVVVVVLALELVFTTFAVRGTGPQMAGGNICPLVGWNTRPSSCSFFSVAALSGIPVRFPPGPTPDVGWKT